MRARADTRGGWRKPRGAIEGLQRRIDIDGKRVFVMTADVSDPGVWRPPPSDGLFVRDRPARQRPGRPAYEDAY